MLRMVGLYWWLVCIIVNGCSRIHAKWNVLKSVLGVDGTVWLIYGLYKSPSSSSIYYKIPYAAEPFFLIAKNRLDQNYACDEVICVVCSSIFLE